MGQPRRRDAAVGCVRAWRLRPVKRPAPGELTGDTHLARRIGEPGDFCRAGVLGVSVLYPDQVERESVLRGTSRDGQLRGEAALMEVHNGKHSRSSSETDPHQERLGGKFYEARR